ncbi:hypothetical protein EDC04DRAFT_666302 [Pisolithus marmoratus]|nr:hypothetical protein EDC04DRAFT_666302 [Pisolithus marmoratus]
MPTKQSKKPSRHSRAIRSFNSMANLSSSRDQSQALSETLARTNTETCDNASRRAFARVRSFFQRSSQSHPTFTSEPSTTGGEVVPQGLSRVDPGRDPRRSINEAALEPVPSAVGKDIYVNVREFDEVNLMSRIDEGAVDLATDDKPMSTKTQAFCHTNFNSFQNFSEIVTTLSNVHPYVQVALGILVAASQVGSHSHIHFSSFAIHP